MFRELAQSGRTRGMVERLHRSTVAVSTLHVSDRWRMREGGRQTFYDPAAHAAWVEEMQIAQASPNGRGLSHKADGGLPRSALPIRQRPPLVKGTRFRRRGPKQPRLPKHPSTSLYILRCFL